MSKFARRIDRNHQEIIAVFRYMECVVKDLSSCGNGVPDLCVHMGGMPHFVEIKDGTKTLSGRKVTKAQIDWAETWPRNVWLVECPEDVIDLVRWVNSDRGGDTWPEYKLTVLSRARSQ